MKHTLLLTIICLLTAAGLNAQNVDTRRLGAQVPITTEGVMIESTSVPNVAHLPRKAWHADNDFTTEGTGFWVTFMQNYEYKASSYELRMQLVFSSRQAANIQVSNPNTGWSTTSSVSANGVTIITVPTAQCYNYGSDKTQNTGLYIQSTAPISVYGSNYASCTFDATNVLPTQSLGTDYVIQSYRTQKEGNTEFAVVATEDNTHVTIVLSSPTLNKNKSTFTIQLNKGQVYQSTALAAKGTLAGTVISADKKVAVFNGDIDAYVPDYYGYCDHMVEQAMPVQSWGKMFAVTKSYGQTADYVMLTAIKDGTVIKKNGTVVATINTCQHYLFRLTEAAAYLETSEPAACYLYQSSRTANYSRLGDPSMVWITPLEQGIKQITFATFKTYVTQYHYVNIVVPTSAVSSMTMDGTTITGFQTVPGNSAYSYVCKKIQHGTHTLYNANAEFVAHVYGMGVDESYAYCVGGYVRKINDTDIEEVIEHETVEQTYDICEGQSVTIAGKEYSSPITFMDTVGNQIKKYSVVVHQSFLQEDTIEFRQGTSFTWRGRSINTPGVYKDELTSKFGCDSIYRLVAKYDNVILTYDTICATAFYKFRGESFALPEGPFPMTYTVKKTEGDWEYHMQLRILPSVEYFTDTYVLEPEEVYTYHGISISSPGSYTVNLTNRHGCDSIVTLTVTQPITTRVYRTICEGDSYEFGGTTYTTAGTYNYSIAASDGTTKVHQLVLTVQQAFHPVLDVTICEGESYDKYGFHESKEGTYYQYLRTVNGCDSVVTLNLSICRPQSTTIDDSFCAGTTYNRYGFSVTKPGTYVQNLRNRYGCDSTVTLTLHEKPSYHFTEKIVLVDDETRQWHGQTLSSKGKYYANYTTQDGCDSIYEAVVRKVVGVAEETYDTLCSATTYTYRGQTFTIPTATTYPFDFVMEVRDIMDCKRYRKILTLVGGTHYPATYELGPNASYTFGTQTITEAGVYTETFTSQRGCDSIVDLTVTQPVISLEYDTAEICSNSGYLWVDGTTITRPGTYIDSFYVEEKQGYDIYQLLLLVHPVYEFTIDTTIQAGQSYVDANFNKNTAGTYHKYYQSIYECDSIYTLNLKVCSPILVPISATIIEGEVYKEGGFTAYTTGDYIHTELSASGCDSTTTLHLTVLPKIQPTYVDASFCQGATYTWEGTTYTKAGTYSKTFTLPDGRDSVRVLRLSTVPVYADTIRAEICEGEVYDLYNFNETTAGTYTHTHTSRGGCDSTMTLILKVNPTYSRDIYETICQGDTYSQYGVSTSTAGDYVRRYTTDQGCDSLLNIHITVAEPSMSNHKVIINEGQSYTWQGTTYTTTTYLCDTLANAAGCDSVAIFDLYVNPLITNNINLRFCQGDSAVLWNDSVVYTEGFYMRNFHAASGADSLVTYGVTVLKHTDSVTTATILFGEKFTWHGKDYTEPIYLKDTLRNAEGCDSICTLDLTVAGKYFRDSAYVCENELDSFVWEGEHFTKDNLVKTKTLVGDSTVRFEVHLLPYTYSLTQQTIKQGESFRWREQDYTITTHIIDTLDNQYSCDSIMELQLTVLERKQTDIPASFCQGDSLVLPRWNMGNDSVVRTPGIYIHTYPTYLGGDSVVTYTVTMLYPTDSVTVASFKEGQSYTWHGSIYTTSTVDYDTLENAVGCDSICRLELTMLARKYTNLPASFCQGDSLILERWTAGKDSVVRTPGIYIHTYPTYLGGDSVVTYTVTMLYPTDSLTTAVIKPGEAYTWHGQTYTTSTVDYDTLENAVGCDSICILQLVVTDATITRDSAYVCENELDDFVWEGEHFTKTQLVKVKTLRPDSIVRFEVLLLATKTGTDRADICTSALPYFWYDIRFDAAGQKQKTFKADNGCDSVVTFTLTTKECYCTPYEALFSLDTICANDRQIVMDIQTLQGEAVNYTIHFDEVAHKAGFRDTTTTLSADGKQLFIPLPTLQDSTRYPRPDTYNMLLNVEDTCGNVSVDTLTFDVLYPSWIITQRWNDVLALNNATFNGGYEFARIQWYHQGVEIAGKGDHNSYIYTGADGRTTLEMGTPYWAKLTRIGETKAICTCHKIPEISTKADTRFPLNVQVSVRRGFIRVTADRSGSYTLYDVCGRMLLSGYISVETLNEERPINGADGTYVIVFRADDGTTDTQKVLMH